MRKNRSKNNKLVLTKYNGEIEKQTGTAFLFFSYLVLHTLFYTLLLPVLWYRYEPKRIAHYPDDVIDIAVPQTGGIIFGQQLQ